MASHPFLSTSRNSGVFSSSNGMVNVNHGTTRLSCYTQRWRHSVLTTTRLNLQPQRRSLRLRMPCWISLMANRNAASGSHNMVLRKAAASSLERRLVCRFVRSVVARWLATPRTPPLWQRDFFLVNSFVLRSLLASERSGVVKTFRCATLTNG